MSKLIKPNENKKYEIESNIKKFFDYEIRVSYEISEKLNLDIEIVDV